MRTNPAVPIPASRFDPMACFHKTQRYLMCETLPLFAALDPQDAHSVTFGLGQLREMLRYCEQVLEYQEAFVAPLVDRLCPGSGASLAMRGEERLGRIDHLRLCSVAVERELGERRSALLALLQQELVTYVASCLTELARTEREVNRVLWPAYTDTCLVRLECEIFAAISLEDLQWGMQWMIPALNGAERMRVLAMLQELAPPELFDAVVAMSEDLLSRRDHERLLQKLESQMAGAA